MTRRSITFVVMSLWLVFAVPAALADTQDILAPQNEPPTAQDGWQAGNCTEENPGELCSPETPEKFFGLAGGHPPFGFTQYTIKHKVIFPGQLEEPEAEIEKLRVDIEPGFSVNPLATERCPLKTFEEDETNCPAKSKVGQEEVTVALNLEIPNPFPPPPEKLPKNFVVAPNPALGTLVPLYNIVPKPGEPARLGFKVGAPEKEEVILETEVEWEGDYHESFTIKPPPASLIFKTLKSRLVSKGQSGNGTYLTLSTTCFSTELPPHEQEYTTFFRAQKRGEELPDFPDGLTKVGATTTLPSGRVHTGCAKVPFDPELEVSPGATQVDSPAGPTVNTTLPFLTEPKEPGAQAESQLRNAEVSLPQGIGINPSGANGLQSCTDPQFGKGTRNEVSGCPDASKIGTVEIETPPLPAGTLKGSMYLGQQLSRDPASGDEFRIFVEAGSKDAGVFVRLEGKTKADPVTGQLTAVLTENPQVPFTSVKLHFDGAKNVLTSPPTCAPVNATSTFEPWSTPASTRHPASNSFAMTSAPGGGTCPTTLAGRPFVPSYTAKTDSTKANAYSPFRVHIGRTDGQQELKKVDVTLPKGLAGNLTGIPYCSESAIVGGCGEQRCGRAGQPELSQRESDRHHLDDERNRVQPADARRQGLSRRSVPGGATVPGRGYAGLGRARSISAPWWSGLPCSSIRKPLRSTRSPIRSPMCTGGSSWTSARSTSTSTGRNSCTTRPTAPPRRPLVSSTVAAPTRPTPAAVELLPGQLAVPGHRLQQARLQAEAAHAPVRRQEHDHPRQAPEAAGDSRSPRR